jgi:deoxyadenosine/deoxycytidine kinase
LIYLRASVRTVRQRIKVRGRPEEQAIPVSYLRSLNKLYEEWFESYSLSPTVVIETDNLDYRTDLEDLIEVRSTIEKHL